MIEQQEVVNVFCVCIFCLGLTLIGTYGVMMDEISAIACSILTGISILAWYHYTLRIYNRFKFDANHDWADEDKDEFDEQFPDNRAEARAARKKREEESAKGFGGIFSIFSKSQSSDESNFESASREKKNGTVVGRTDSANVGAAATTLSSAAGTGASGDMSLFTGYLTMKTGSMFSKSMSRRYFVIRGSFALYYHSKEEFEIRPNDPINKRPISLEGYLVDVEMSETEFKLVLSPDDNDEDDMRKRWEFRCDTQSELDAWRQAFLVATRGSRGAGEGEATANPVSSGASVVSRK